MIMVSRSRREFVRGRECQCMLQSMSRRMQEYFLLGVPGGGRKLDGVRVGDVQSGAESGGDRGTGEHVRAGGSTHHSAASASASESGRSGDTEGGPGERDAGDDRDGVV